MAEKIKILFVSDTKVGGKHIDKGTITEIDPDVASDKTNYALLVHAGRVAAATPENIAKVNEEIAAEARHKRPSAVTSAASARGAFADQADRAVDDEPVELPPGSKVKKDDK